MKIINYIVNFIEAFFGKEGFEVKEDFSVRASDEIFTLDTDIVIKKDFLTKNRNSRSGKKKKGQKGIVVHWVANPNTSAKANRNYFQSRKGTKTFASAEFLIDLDGDIIQAIPENEVAYHCGIRKKQNPQLWKKLGGNPNHYLQGAECTHYNWSGKMHDETIEGLFKLVVYQLKKYDNDSSDLYLHQDISGKRCHRWYVDNPQEWNKFKDRVQEALS